MTALLELHRRGHKLGVWIYSSLTLALKDDYEEVRLEAIILIWVLCNLYGNFKVSTSNERATLRLVDDGFVKVCDMINDVSVRVRAKAAEMLGSFRDVEERFLMQTLSKQIMSNLKVKNSVAESEKEREREKEKEKDRNI